MRKGLRTYLIVSWSVVVSAIAIAQDAPKPRVSNDPMTAEQIAIYRAVLENYLKGSERGLNLAKQTEPLERSGPFWDEHCTKSIALEPAPPARALVHTLDPAVAPSDKVVLVDPDAQTQTVKENDPQKLVKRAIEDGEKVTDEQIGDAVKTAVKTGLFTLSEIVFDAWHRNAVVSYSFYCGELCGHGNLVILKKVGAKWKIKKQCGGWVS